MEIGISDIISLRPLVPVVSGWSTILSRSISLEQRICTLMYDVMGHDQQASHPRRPNTSPANQLGPSLPSGVYPPLRGRLTQENDTTPSLLRAGQGPFFSCVFS